MSHFWNPMLSRRRLQFAALILGTVYFGLSALPAFAQLDPLAPEDEQLIEADNQAFAAQYDPPTVFERLAGAFADDFELTGAANPPNTLTAFERALLSTKIVTAVSTDGVRFTRTQTDVSSFGAYPSLINAYGNLFVYFQAYLPGKNSTPIVAAVSDDAGRTWANRFISITGVPADRAITKPFAIRLPNGTVRLYFIMQANNRDGKGERLFFADSSDGFRFRLINYAFGSEKRYPAEYAIVNIANEWQLFVQTAGQTDNFVATSPNANFFVPKKRLNFVINGRRALVFSGLNFTQTEGVFRLYAYAPGQRTMRSYISEDFINWQGDAGINLKQPALTRQEDGTIRYPSVVTVPYSDNRNGYLMVFQTGKRF